MEWGLGGGGPVDHAPQDSGLLRGQHRRRGGGGRGHSLPQGRVGALCPDTQLCYESGCGLESGWLRSQRASPAPRVPGLRRAAARPVSPCPCHAEHSSGFSRETEPEGCASVCPVYPERRFPVRNWLTRRRPRSLTIGCSRAADPGAPML